MVIFLFINIYILFWDSNIFFGLKDFLKFNKCKILVLFFNKLLLIIKNVYFIKVECK